MGHPDEGLLEASTWMPTKPERVARTSPYLRVILQIVRPSFLSKASARTTKLRRTAYLDGVRGFAALLVYWGHHQLWAHEPQHADRILENAFGYENQYYFATLPGIRTFFSGGHYSVSTFFVISGYVLSAKPLSLIHSSDHLALGDNVASALFRRWIRLYLPLIVTTFLMLVLWHGCGVLPNFEPRRTFRDELWQWYTEFKNFSFIFRGGGGEPWLSYHFHSWSIPVEMKGSIVIYTAVTAFSRCTHSARLWCEIGLIWYFMYIVDGGHYAMFMAGMLLCDLDLLAAANNLPVWMQRLKPYKQYIFGCLFVASVLLGGCPSYSWDIQSLRNSPGWYYLSKLAPQAVFDYKWFYLFWAAAFLVSSVQHIAPLKRFFESRFCQYLGRVSYAFYLFHGIVLWTLGDRLYAATGMTRESHALGIPGWVNRFPLPRVGPFGLEPSFLLPHLVLLPVTFWISEIGTTLIDEPSIRIAAWMYRSFTAPEI